jgi:manganese transport protein
MEGYLRLRISPALRRMITRVLAIGPAVLVLVVWGDKMVDQMLLFSQVLLSMQLAFAVVPLIHFVSDRKKMGDFAISTRTRIGAWVVAAVIIALNLKLFGESVAQWLQGTDQWWLQVLVVLLVAAIGVLLLITIIYPFVLQRREANISVHGNIAATVGAPAEPFRCIALALDFSDNDEKVLRYGMHLGKDHAHFVLIHVVESASARLIGNEAHDYETRKDQAHLDSYVQLMKEAGFDAQGILGYKSRSGEIARIVNDCRCDLLIIGSHGHNTAKDFIFGETINTVRHLIHIPVFIAR